MDEQFFKHVDLSELTSVIQKALEVTDRVHLIKAANKMVSSHLEPETLTKLMREIDAATCTIAGHSVTLPELTSFLLTLTQLRSHKRQKDWDGALEALTEKARPMTNTGTVFTSTGQLR